MKSITRKINLANYGGATYESCDFMIADEKKSFKELELELDQAIISFIKNLPRQMAMFSKAKDESEPFISQTELKNDTTLNINKFNN